MNTKINSPGIDRCVIGGLDLIDVDLEKLYQSSAGFWETDGKGMSVQIGSVRINRISVSESDFSLVVGVNVNPEKNLFLYTNLDLTKKGINLKNLTPEDLCKQVADICEYMHDKYGLKFGFKGAFLKSVEINKTLSLEKPYGAYKDVLRLIIQLLPAAYKVRQDPIKDNGQLGTAYAHYYSGEQKLKIYDKARQLKDVKGFLSNKNLMRIEYTLSGKSIENWLGTNKLFNLCQEDINSFWERRTKKDILEPFSIWQADRIKCLRSIMPSRTEKNWGLLWLSRILVQETDRIVLCSGDDLKNIIRSVGDQKLSRTMKRLSKWAESVGCYDILSGERADRINEVIGTVMVFENKHHEEIS